MFRKSFGRALAWTSMIAAQAILALMITPAVYRPAQGLYSTPLGQLLLNHASNTGAVAAWTNLVAPLEVGGYATTGDGGRHRMTYDPSKKCGAGGHPAADGVTCVNSTIGGGSWNIDWASVNFVATMPLFGSFGRGNQTADTAAVVAATATGRDVMLPAGTYFVRTGIWKQAADNQRFFGSGNSSNVIVGCVLPAAPSTTNPCLDTNGHVGLRLNDIHMNYPNFPSTSMLSDGAAYGPLVKAQNAPGMRWRDVILGRAYTDLDMTGNTGGSNFEDYKYSCTYRCNLIDGSLDTVTFDDSHGFPYDLYGGQTTLFNGQAVGFYIGRMDHLIVTGGLYIGSLAFSFYSGTGANPGPAFGNIDAFDCDGHSCIFMNAPGATIQATDLISTLGYSSSNQTLVNQAGVLTLTNPTIEIGASLTGPVVQSVQGGVTSIVGGSTQFLGAVNQFNATVFQSGASGNPNGQLTVTGHYVVRPAGTSGTPANWTQPVFQKYARLVAIGNVLNDSGTTSGTSGSNVFINDTADNYDRIIGNVSPGSTNVFPSSVSYAVIQGNNPVGVGSTPN